jgi:hypothetical protein
MILSISRFLQHPLARVTLILLVVLAASQAPVPFPWKLPAIALVALVLVWFETRGMSAIGLGRHSPAATLLWGVALAFGAVVVIGEVIQPLLEEAIGLKTDYSALGGLAGNLPAALSLTFYAMLSAAVGEEVALRGFLLHEFDALLSERLRWASVTLAACVFGALHAPQGWSGIIATSLVGLLFGWAFFRSGRNLWALILAHALTDICGVMMIYFGRYA